ncbi:RNA polymerase sigma factor [Paraliomyxa miuraensis]|uniref:RNA polymerase sigma factor n=1 Tax=Paraliomyxa miuraensis TaxID=376150 RepID=UPI0022542C7D|nr:sigma-70 family RNA polymerase sigma factor [Paraliomyxa miuraensis]MCX4239582.1 sigma-70 family RNA polymerase sigma factor [Paraliomyxa miuraensis]
MSLRETLSAARLSRQAVAASAGDTAAFRQLYRALHPLVWRYVSRRIAGRADVEDLVSRTFMRVVEHLHRFEPERGNVRAWVLGIARNAVIDHLRHQRASGDADVLERLADAAFDPARALEDDERQARLRALLSSQPAVVREMFALRFGDGLRVREIAALLDMSEAAVKQRFARTLRELRGKLEVEASQKGAAGYAI